MAIGTKDSVTLTTTPYKAFTGTTSPNQFRSAVRICAGLSNTDAIYFLIVKAGDTAPANLAAITGDPRSIALSAGDEYFGASDSGFGSDIYLVANSGSQAAVVEESGASADPQVIKKAAAVRLQDGSNGNQVTVQAFHNADNQQLSATSYGLLTGGVPQLVNLAGGLDRQREVTTDNNPGQGYPIAVTAMGMSLVTTSSGNYAIGTSTFTLTAVSGTYNGVPWSIQPGTILIFEPDTANQESLEVSTVNAGTKVVTTISNSTIAHNGSTTAFKISGFTYNIQRDASGEPSGTRGRGAPTAIPYLYNGGAANGTANYDKLRSLEGEKGVVTYLTSAAAAGATSVVLASATGYVAGEHLVVLDAITGPDKLYSRQDYTNGTTTVVLENLPANAHAVGGSSTLTSSPSAGATTFTVASSTGQTQNQYAIINPTGANAELIIMTNTPGTTVTCAALQRPHASGETIVYGPLFFYDAFDVLGPQTGIMGVAAEEAMAIAAWDPASKSIRLLTVTSQNGQPTGTTLAVSPGLSDGSGNVVAQKAGSATGDAHPANTSASVALSLYNGTTWDRQRCLPNATGTARVTTGGGQTTAIAAANASNTVVKASSGRLARVLVTTVGANAMQIYDNASTTTGTLIGVIPASAAVGTVISFEMPAANGITVAGSATNPAVTISWD
jgi:hypothetical protein